MEMLDDQIAMILQDMKYDLLKEIGMYISNPLKMNNEGIIEAGKVRIKLGIKLLKFPVLYKTYKNNEQNLKIGTYKLDEYENQVKDLKREIENYNKPAKSVQILEVMSRLICLHKNISYIRFRYSIFPSIIAGRKLDKFLKKLDKNIRNTICFKVFECDTILGIYKM